MFSVNVLFYGNHFDLANRCLNSIIDNADWSCIRELRVGFNAVCLETREMVLAQTESVPVPCHIYEESTGRNVGKEPMVRRMLFDPERPIAGDSIMWFDDDSYLLGVSGWWQAVRELSQQCVMVGSTYGMQMRGNQHLAVRQQPWYTGKRVAAGHLMTFAQGGWWVAQRAVIEKWNFPSREFHHNDGADCMLGELCRQQGYSIKNFNFGVAINADEKGRESMATRRAADATQVWEHWTPDAKPDLSHQDFEVTVRSFHPRRCPPETPPPDVAEIFYNWGKALLDQGSRRVVEQQLPPHERQIRAVHLFQEAVRLKPDWADAHSDLGEVLYALGQLTEAERCFRQALESDVAHPTARKRLDTVLAEQGLIPQSAETLNSLAGVFYEQGRYDEAAATFQKCLRARVDYFDGWFNFASFLWQTGKWPEAELAYRQARSLQPGLAAPWNQLGLVLAAQGKHGEAEECFRQSIHLDAQEAATAHNNLGAMFASAGRFDQAAAEFQECLRLRPDWAATHRSLALVCLKVGDFARGWSEWEWRWKCPDHDALPAFHQPRWDGRPLAGKPILLMSEEGLGDTIQFVRYASLVRERGGRVILACQPQLIPLLRSFPEVDQLVSQRGPLPDFEVFAPLLSLPAILQTTLESIPARSPYLFPSAVLVDRWREELRPIEGFKIGIAWQGSTSYVGDAYRSIPLQRFEPLAQVAGVQLISLQKGYGAEQLESWVPSRRIIDYGNKLDEQSGAFMDTAAVMANLDLIITSDSAIAHLAGALGMPVWLALPMTSDWRWFVGRDDTPWYPTMRLFRQSQWGDWNGVLEHMASELKHTKSSRSLARQESH